MNSFCFGSISAGFGLGFASGSSGFRLRFAQFRLALAPLCPGFWQGLAGGSLAFLGRRWGWAGFGLACRRVCRAFVGLGLGAWGLGAWGPGGLGGLGGSGPWGPGGRKPPKTTENC